MSFGRYCNKGEIDCMHAIFPGYNVLVIAGPLSIGIVDTATVGQYKISLKNNADNYTGIFHFLVNGKEERNVTLSPDANEQYDTL